MPHQDYTKLSTAQRAILRELYIEEQKGKCYYCGGDLKQAEPLRIRVKPINYKLFPPGFFNAPIHLQHNHSTKMTEGAVHSYCNAVMWQYEGR
jgi:hypothetical protein